MDYKGRFYAAYHNQSNGGYIYEMMISKFTCKYDANGGTGTMANSEHVYGTSKALSTNAFKRENFDFMGWTAKRSSDSKLLYSSADGTSTGWYKSGKQPSGWVKNSYR